MLTPTTRCIVLLRVPDPLGGRCPACESVMDQSGCRLGDDLLTPELATTKGIARIVETFCTGQPTAPVIPCPACGER